MRFVVRRGLLWLAQFVALLLAGVAVAACLSLASGCGSAAQRAVSAAAVVAVAADQANALAYEQIAADTLADVQSDGGSFPDWCAAMVEPWQTCSRVECAVEALADLAMTGQDILDAGDSLDAHWFSAACGALAAVDDAWAAAETPPAVLTQARKLICGLADGSRAGVPECADPGPPPPCPEVSP
jgi:hypothetical protein